MSSSLVAVTLKSIESSLKKFCECSNILDTTKNYNAEVEAVTTQLSEKKFSQTYSDFKNEVTEKTKFFLNYTKMHELLPPKLPPQWRHQ